jgi:hypothetical protein
MKTKTEQVIWNTEQSDFFRWFGCTLVKIDKGFSEKLKKVGVFHVWQIDEVFLEAKDIWNKRTR